MKDSELLYKSPELELSLRHRKYIRCSYCDCWSHYFFSSPTESGALCREHARTLELPEYIKSIL